MTRTKEFPLELTWRPILKDLGVNHADVLRRACLPEDSLSRPNTRVGTGEYFRFWESVEAEVGDPLLPLRLVEVATPESFSPPIFAAMCSPNLLVAMRRLRDYKRLIMPVVLHVEETEETFKITPEWLDTTLNPPLSLVVSELVFFTKLARLATREPINPVRVMTRRTPKPAAEYTRFFGVPVQRGEEHSITFALEDAKRPFLTANEAMWQIFEPDLRRRLAKLDDSATSAQRVRAALLEALPSGQTSMELIAARLAMSKRTLQRRLKGEGTTFQDILGQTRENLARHYLTTTDLSCAEISYLLGFEDPNSFFRAFNAWTGSSPERVRQSSCP